MPTPVQENQQAIFGEPGMPTGANLATKQSHRPFRRKRRRRFHYRSRRAGMRFERFEIHRRNPEDQDWVRLTQAQFDPIQISDRLWITPSWHEAPNGNAVNLQLDPGLAFGTGSHPTTRLCLKWLDTQLKGGESVLDYGCGSGILAIAALSNFGAGSAIGVRH